MAGRVAGLRHSDCYSTCRLTTSCHTFETAEFAFLFHCMQRLWASVSVPLAAHALELHLLLISLSRFKKVF